MNVFLIPLQERISLSLLYIHPLVLTLSLIISNSVSSYLHLPIISELCKIFFPSWKKKILSGSCILYFIVMSIITFPEYACLIFYYWAMLITFDKFDKFYFLSIHFNRFVRSLRFLCLLLFLLVYDMTVYVSYLSLTSFLSFSVLLFLWRFLIFIHSPGVPRRDWQRKGKEHEKVFLIESVYQCIDMCIYICIDHKRTVRGVTFFSSVIGAAYHCRDENGKNESERK